MSSTTTIWLNWRRGSSSFTQQNARSSRVSASKKLRSTKRSSRSRFVVFGVGIFFNDCFLLQMSPQGIFIYLFRLLMNGFYIMWNSTQLQLRKGMLVCKAGQALRLCFNVVEIQCSASSRSILELYGYLKQLKF